METILLVDDDPAVREIFSVYLEREGYDAIAVSGGAECIDLLKTCIPDLILLDMMMEPMDGWDTLLSIKYNPDTAHIPIIIVTGRHPTYADIIRYGGHIEDFIMKPVDFPRIAGSIREVIERSGDIRNEALKKETDGHDPVLINEYFRLLRIVRVARTLIGRFRNQQWADRALFERQEQELLRLHTKIGFPDGLLDHGTVVV
jgi:two-component system OmpR family response regulator